MKVRSREGNVEAAQAVRVVLDLTITWRLQNMSVHGLTSDDPDQLQMPAARC
jgi:hypothetical protein